MTVSAYTEPFDHPALFYRDEQEYVAGTVPFVRAGLDAGEPVAVAVPPANLDLIRDELGDLARHIRLLDMTQEGRNPGRIIPRVLRAFADAHPAQRVRIIGEPIWAGRSETEYPACVQHEALINLAFQGREATILCPYDTTRLEESVLTDAYATHPTVIASGTEETSHAYAPDEIVARYNQPLTALPEAWETTYGAGMLAEIRHQALRRAHDLGLPADRMDDLALAVAELTTNSVKHAGGSGTLRMWSQDRYIVCEVRDAGHLDDPLAGRRPPPRGQVGGRGLLLVNVVADLVRVHTTPEQGTVIQCHFRCDATAA
ncbi:sensor histidine kinase [Streptomyces indicus]|uniref:Anti-sigma regulatory factor (Ser/Thr protein kinase) n=1 Tax=Streptomyces indicus TaxID=417292 RepID=A0A1G9A1T1_9ACTN|nr:sensor histidine kinase [Streptomyces indicus]SDK21308.1 Anti-sigma regulatory factor (Ser/Thr protein kinase) [Streptomyces indicus]